MASKHARARVVSVCVTGRPAAQERSNDARFELMALIARAISARRWSGLDAVLFPAGYFRSDLWFGPLSGLDRALAFDAEPFGDHSRAMARKLGRRSPGCHVVVGLDTRRSRHRFSGDQLVVAFDGLGVSGAARKVFPVDGDTNCWERAPYLLFENDPDDPWRVLRLPSGGSALLSVCYDAFALAELRIGPTPKRRALRYFSDETDDWRWCERVVADAYLQRLDDFIEDRRPKINLVAIHGFERPGGELRWQRHGIATASAALNGAMTVGAAHYKHALPYRVENQPLAAARVDERQLWMAAHRPAATFPAVDGFYVKLSRPRLDALVRLFVEP